MNMQFCKHIAASSLARGQIDSPKILRYFSQFSQLRSFVAEIQSNTFYCMIWDSKPSQRTCRTIVVAFIPASNVAVASVGENVVAESSANAVSAARTR